MEILLKCIIFVLVLLILANFIYDKINIEK